MAAQYAYVPEGMSYVNAWYALYKSAYQYAEYFEWNPEDCQKAQQAVSTSEKVANLFKNYSDNRDPQFYMEYEGAKKMKVHFCNFPKLEVYYYDTTYGFGAAQRALENYNKVPSKDRFDKNDSFRFTELPQVIKDLELKEAKKKMAEMWEQGMKKYFGYSSQNSS